MPPSISRKPSYAAGSSLHRRWTSEHIDSTHVREDDQSPSDEEDGQDDGVVEEADDVTVGGDVSPSLAPDLAPPSSPLPAGGDLEKGGREVGPRATRQSTRRSERLPPEERQWKDDIVTFDSRDDPTNPKNWSYGHKISVVFMLGFTTMSATFASSIFSSGTNYISKEFGISTEVVTLGTSLFLLGFVFGPVVWAPISEQYGRKISVLPPLFVFMCFSAGTAVAKDVQTIMITRFFGGFFASAPVSNVGGGLADMFDQRDRATAVVMYSLAIVAGPTLGPIIGAAVSEDPSLTWRWTMYLVVILTATILFFDLIFLPETYAARILQVKAHDLRFRTGRWALHSRLDMQDTSLAVFMEQNLLRPVKMTFTEPILMAIITYNGFAYGTLYMLFSAVPIIFAENRGWKPVPSALPFLAVLVGCFTAAGINIVYSAKYYVKRADRSEGPLPPELRLPPMMLGSIVFPVGFFLLGWTSDPSIHWFPSFLGLFFVGMAFLLIFQAGINFAIDTYTQYAASAIAANTFVRSIFAAGLPLVTQALFHNLGIDFACTLLGCVAVVMAGVPFLFWIYGPRLRAMSKMARKG